MTTTPHIIVAGSPEDRLARLQQLFNNTAGVENLTTLSREMRKLEKVLAKQEKAKTKQEGKIELR